MTYRFIVLLGAVLVLGGCTTIIRGTHDEMKVSTEPPGALVTTSLETRKSVRDRRWGRANEPFYYGCPSTPCEFKAPRKSKFLLMITKDGFEPVEIGVDGRLGKTALTANLAASVGAGAVVGAGTAGIASLTTLGLSSGVGAGAAAGAATAGVGLALIVVDAASGAFLNLNPNPIEIILPPEGTTFEPHEKAVILRKELEEKDLIEPLPPKLEKPQDNSPVVNDTK